MTTGMRMRLICAATALLATTAGCGKRGAEPAAPTSPPLPPVQGAPEPTPKPEERPAFLDLPERTVPGRVFIIAIDGASWDVFDQVLETGLMPNLGRIVAQGSRTALESMDPTASAILWTTIATGRKPKHHGVHGFVVKTPEGRTVPVSSTVRRVRAMWNIASEAGVSVGFISWWVTWPAEPVRGFMCSDYTWPLKKDEAGFATGADADLDLPQRTYPPDLMKALERFIKTEDRLSPAELASLELQAVRNIKSYAVRDILLKDVSVGNMSAYLLERYKPSLVGVYFDGYDAFCHLYWPEYRRVLSTRAEGGEAAVRQLDPTVQALGRSIESHLARIDIDIGSILQRTGPNDTVLVISDHGFGDNPGRAPIQRTYDDWIQPPFWHHRQGILAASGGPIRKGQDGVAATITDIAPTVLALLGLPVGKDMDGRVLTELLTPEFLAQHPVRFVDTYDPAPRVSAPVESAYDEGMKNRLKALGYIEDADEDDEE
ncbi:MAG: alkaline phosphatase family protein [Phycisphaerae bacterium]|nr:MAG: hypothetical protein F9K17_13625 [Phycisphaerae bacterium]MBE7457036.1 alkaline phosphatase family protein [Planctomycetia bacterium]MCK6463606.1 alkaline phosphatase family protein [Phycisphaerae bacterium]MCL4718274.1 alkaline phosphatase family protein [Phycisphaerae bacterium]NUQ09997.1 alkaline phosphatase family protein [Phycisphaerae bacterium]